MTVAFNSQVATALLRSSLYLLLARAFTYPQPDSLPVLQEHLNKLGNYAGEWPEELRRLVSRLCRGLRTAGTQVSGQDYLRLFGPAGVCPLTETSWGDAARLLGKAAQMADIAGFYRAFKLQPREDSEQAPEDHLASELEFMSVLCLKEANALNVELDEALEIMHSAQKKFIEEHIAAWIDFWAESVKANACGSVYALFADSLQSLIRYEVGRLGLHPVSIRTRVADKEAGNDEFICPLTGTP